MYSRRNVLKTGAGVGALLTTAPLWSTTVSPARNPQVEFASGKISGYRADGVSVFKGIPYAAAPVGNLRFRPPAPVIPWAGVKDASSYGASAPQYERKRTGIYSSIEDVQERDEDCLFLNVWTPATDNARRPVMVWWHGGGFEVGSGSSSWFDGQNLCRRGDVVVVTVNHRLNVFGHCYLAGVLGSEWAESGNVGFLDLVASLQWVSDNIERFGGDPKRVMIFGQSGGGRKVSIAMASKAAEGLFHRAAVQSGSHLRLLKEENAHALTEQLLQELDIKKSEAHRLQAVGWEQLQEAQRRVLAKMKMRFAPVWDNSVFHGHPWDPAAPNTSASVPMLIGTTRTELSSQVGNDDSVYQLDRGELERRLAAYLPSSDIDSVIERFAVANPHAGYTELFFLIISARGYIRNADLQTERRVLADQAPVYRYSLDWRTPVEGGRRLSPHSLDVPLVFDNVAKAASMVGYANPEAARVAAQVSDAWIAFARDGNPGKVNGTQWQSYDLEQRLTMLLNTDSRLVVDPYQVERLVMAAYPSDQADSRVQAHRR